VLVLATNVFNLLDLRPGRSVKAFVLLGIGLTLSTQNTEALAAMGIFAGAVLVAGFYDLRERAMLGDTGSNAIGALAGLWMVLTLDTDGQLVALVVLVLINIFGEFRSISSVIEKTPGLRHLDSAGRPT
jgi:UDP-N-acetylmuramyl pentapeptide phosphotransferase/UDP-N-acetylglucosamine-1-phosphate transferase